MPIIIIIEKNCEIKSLNLKNLVPEELYKKTNFKNDKGFSCKHTWKLSNGNEILLYGKTDGRANHENKYELPSPVDNMLLFGSFILVQRDNNHVAIDLKPEQWKTIYNHLHGGFDSIDDNEDEDDDADDVIGERTSHGYLKDGFVVEESSETESESESESETETESESESESESKSKSKSKSESESKKESKSNNEIKTASSSNKGKGKNECKYEIESKIDSDGKSKFESMSESMSESKCESSTKPAVSKSSLKKTTTTTASIIDESNSSIKLTKISPGSVTISGRKTKTRATNESKELHQVSDASNENFYDESPELVEELFI